MTEPAHNGQSIYISRPEKVRDAISRLTSRQVHPFFLAYLVLRQHAESRGNDQGLHPSWDAIGKYLRVPGGPPRRPYFRPLFTTTNDRTRYWMNRNLAGSWSPSSLREGMPPRFVVEPANHGFNLLNDHASLAKRHLLFDEPLILEDLVVFLYRDYGWTPDTTRAGQLIVPKINDLLQHFFGEFRFYQPDASIHDDATVLFDLKLYGTYDDLMEVLHPPGAPPAEQKEA